MAFLPVCLILNRYSIYRELPVLERSYHVAPGVLIPRPETEELVEVMLREIPSDARILDIGTGSGCIAISLSKAFPNAKVTAWDVSEDALCIARRNNDDCRRRFVL